MFPMRTHPLFLLLVAGAVLCTACQKEPEQPKVAPAPAAQVVAPAPPPAEIGQNCSQDCGNGVKAEIVCAEGETPVCACAPSPSAKCEPASAKP
jgi:hypothetical protein